MGSTVELVEYAFMCSEEDVMGEIVWGMFETEFEDKKECSKMLSKEILPLRINNEMNASSDVESVIP